MFNKIIGEELWHVKLLALTVFAAASFLYLEQQLVTSTLARVAPTASEQSAQVVSGTGATLTATFTELGYDAPELVNSLRGYYRWRGGELLTLPEAAADDYDRYTWRDLEPSRGVYNFSEIDADLAAAKARGSRFAFRIRDMVGYGDNRLYVPDYLSSYGWWTNNTFVPDYNSPEYLARMQALLNALGQRYGNDPSISFIDIGLYGQYGEWSLSSSRVDYANAPSGIVPVTLDTKRKIIDYHAAAFPRTQLLVKMTVGSADAAQYAFGLNTERPIGTRIDCLGQVGYFSQFTNRPAVMAIYENRWMVAPLITEYCSGAIQFDVAGTDDALGQVERFHVSAVGNGNVSDPAYANRTDAERAAYAYVGKRAGYRLVLNSVTLPSEVAPGANVSVVTAWKNAGVANVYEPWQVVLEYVEATGAHTFTLPLPITLRDIVAGTERSFTSSAVIPATTPSGTYNVSLKVVPTDTVRRNMKLAVREGNSISGYPVGKVVVRGGTTTPPPPEPDPVPLDTDADGVADATDNCPTVANQSQVDTDADGQGDACDATPQGDQVWLSRFNAGDRVTVTERVNVRNAPSGSRVGRQSTGATGVIGTSRPVQSGGYTWVYVNFESGVDGWVVDKYLATAQTATVTSTWAIGTNVITTSAVKVRSTYGLSGYYLGRQGSGSTGAITGGPATADGYVWVKVNFSSGVDGWVAATYLKKQ